MKVYFGALLTLLPAAGTIQPVVISPVTLIVEHATAIDPNAKEAAIKLDTEVGPHVLQVLRVVVAKKKTMWA